MFHGVIQKITLAQFFETVYLAPTKETLCMSIRDLTYNCSLFDFVSQKVSSDATARRNKLALSVVFAIVWPFVGVHTFEHVF